MHEQKHHCCKNLPRMPCSCRERGLEVVAGTLRLGTLRLSDICLSSYRRGCPSSCDHLLHCCC